MVEAHNGELKRKVGHNIRPFSFKADGSPPAPPPYLRIGKLIKYTKNIFNNQIKLNLIGFVILQNLESLCLLTQEPTF